MADPEGDMVLVAAGGEMHRRGCVLLAVGGTASVSEDKDHVRAEMLRSAESKPLSGQGGFRGRTSTVNMPS